MERATQTVLVILMLSYPGIMGCQRDNPTEHVEMSTDKAAEAIERAINTPIEKAKAVEGILQRAADRTAEQTEKAGE